MTGLKSCRKHTNIGILTHSFTDTNNWSGVVVIPKNKDIPYRYLVCTVDPNTGHTHVRRWETHLTPRKISAYHDDNDTLALEQPSDAVESASTTGQSSISDTDTFGDINGEEKIDRGWLTTETVLQFKFYRNPFILKQKLKNKLLYVKVSHTKMIRDRDLFT